MPRRVPVVALTINPSPRARRRTRTVLSRELPRLARSCERFRTHDAIQELGHRRIGLDPVGQLDQAMSFVLEAEVFHELPARLERVHHLLSLSHGHSWVIRPVDN